VCWVYPDHNRILRRRLTYTYSYADSHSNGDTHTDGNADSHRYGNSYSYGNSNVYCNSHINADSHCYSNSASCVANPNYSAQNYADAQAAADESSSGRALSGTLKAGTRERHLASSPPEMEGSARVPQRMVWEAPEKLSG
jgi:hypothetical protein